MQVAKAAAQVELAHAQAMHDAALNVSRMKLAVALP
jgi:hypothetical protein